MLHSKNDHNLLWHIYIKVQLTNNEIINEYFFFDNWFKNHCETINKIHKV